MTVMGTTTTLMSFAEFERLEQGPDQIELLKGELIRVPPPLSDHMEICHRLYKPLDAGVDLARKANPSVKLGKVFIEMGYLLSSDPRSWLRPDVSVTHPDQTKDRYYLGAPLMAFEIVSENDSARELEAKVTEFLAHGAAEVWVIYPDVRHAWVYNRSTGAARCETKSIRSDLLPGIEIPLDEIL